MIDTDERFFNVQKYFKMTEKSKQEYEEPDYEKLYAEYPDEEIIAILKKRKHYRKEAAIQAIQEAIKRGIINSEQDLISEDYAVEPLKFSIIPDIENETARKKIRKSLSRSLMILGVVPVIWGTIKIIYNMFLEGSLLMLLGIIWIFISYKQIKNVSAKFISLQFVLLASAAIYIWRDFSRLKGHSLMDILVAIIGFGFVIYALLFLRTLKQNT